jgi:unsaturated rhamnogalacturonyl hydrolase
LEGFICVKTGYRPTVFDLNNINNGKLLLLLYRITGKEKYWKAAILLRDQLRTHPRTKAGSKVTVTNEKWQLDFG